jgi:hypothetical protein
MMNFKNNIYFGVIRQRDGKEMDSHSDNMDILLFILNSLIMKFNNKIFFKYFKKFKTIKFRLLRVDLTLKHMYMYLKDSNKFMKKIFMKTFFR